MHVVSVEQQRIARGMQFLDVPFPVCEAVDARAAAYNEDAVHAHEKGVGPAQVHTHRAHDEQHFKSAQPHTQDLVGMLEH